MLRSSEAAPQEQLLTRLGWFERSSVAAFVLLQLLNHHRAVWPRRVDQLGRRPWARHHCTEAVLGSCQGPDFRLPWPFSWLDDQAVLRAERAVSWMRVKVMSAGFLVCALWRAGAAVYWVVSPGWCVSRQVQHAEERGG